MVITQEFFQDFKRGQMDAFYASVYPSLIVYATRVLGGDYAFLAEDCVQDSIYMMYEQREKFASPAHFKSYLYATIHNKAVNCLRRDRCQQKYLAQPREQLADLQASIIEQETIDRLHQAIEQLPTHLREIFDMSYEQALRNGEIARQLGISLTTVKKRKSQMIDAFRRTLADDDLMIVCAFLLTLEAR